MIRERSLRWTVSISVSVALFGCSDRAAQEAKITQAQAQVARIAEDLDRQTTEAGVYVRVKDGKVNETDPWGTPIEVVYSQGGVAETVVVRSAGPDRQFHTTDDIQASGMSANLKGIGQGVQKNIEQTVANAAKGVVKGAVAGAKEALKESIARKKPADDEQSAPEADAKEKSP